MCIRDRFGGGDAGAGREWKQTQALVNAYIGPALSAYFDELGIDPFEEGRP